MSNVTTDLINYSLSEHPVNSSNSNDEINLIYSSIMGQSNLVTSNKVEYNKIVSNQITDSNTHNIMDLLSVSSSTILEDYNIATQSNITTTTNENDSNNNNNTGPSPVKINMYRRLLDSDRTYFGSDVSRDVSHITCDENSYNCCLYMIVRNESHIINRCLDGVSQLVDCICICDTGSTDNTVELIHSWSKEYNIPTTVYVPTGTGGPEDTTWRTFCYNRTQSFVLASGTYPCSKYYLTVDADMILRIDSAVDWSTMNADGYNLDQTSDFYTYSNPRIMNGKAWLCEDYTHEAWNSPGNYPTKINQLWIDDRGDGGCKGDKLHRDVCFSLCQIIQKRGRSRQDFYLANTFNDLRDYDMAIYWYWQRYNKDDWEEEKWMALYRIGECYLKKHQYGTKVYWPHEHQTIDDYNYLIDGQPQRPGWDLIDTGFLHEIERNDAENLGVKYLLQAYDTRPWRAESLMMLSKYYREIGSHTLSIFMADQVALMIEKHKPMLPGFRDSLIVRVPEHSYQPYIEISICAYYVKEYSLGINAGLKVLQGDIVMPRNNPIPDNIISWVQRNLLAYWNKCTANELEHRDKYENQIAYNYAHILLPLAQEPKFIIGDRYVPWYSIAINAYYISKFDEGEQAIAHIRTMDSVPQNILTGLSNIEKYYVSKRQEQRKQAIQQNISNGNKGLVVGGNRKARGKHSNKTGKKRR